MIDVDEIAKSKENKILKLISLKKIIEFVKLWEIEILKILFLLVSVIKTNFIMVLKKIEIERKICLIIKLNKL